MSNVIILVLTFVVIGIVGVSIFFFFAFNMSKDSERRFDLKILMLDFLERFGFTKILPYVLQTDAFIYLFYLYIIFNLE
jgi:hypothetical protein